MGNSTHSKVNPEAGNQVVVKRNLWTPGCFKQFTKRKVEERKSDEIFKENLVICVHSWCSLVKVATVHDKIDPSNTLAAVFCAECCDRLLTGAPQVHKRLITADAAKLTGTACVLKRYCLLLKILQYILQLEDNSITTKQELRALGRAHLRRNIGEAESKLFTNAVLETLASLLGSHVSPDILQAWVYILNFVVEQMYFDKIVFRSHFTPAAAVAAEQSPQSSGHNRPMSARSDESNKTSRLMAGLANIFGGGGKLGVRESVNSSSSPVVKETRSSVANNNSNSDPSSGVSGASGGAGGGGASIRSMIWASLVRSRSSSSKKDSYSWSHTSKRSPVTGGSGAGGGPGSSSVGNSCNILPIIELEDYSESLKAKKSGSRTQTNQGPHNPNNSSSQNLSTEKIRNGGSSKKSNSSKYDYFRKENTNDGVIPLHSSEKFSATTSVGIGSLFDSSPGSLESLPLTVTEDNYNGIQKFEEVKSD